MKTVDVFLPCRKGSERVKDKNTRPIGSYQNGLIEIKLKQLLSSDHVNKIFLSTNDDSIIEFANSLNEEKINIHKRSEALSGNETNTDSLIGHVLDLDIPDEILWTHVTSPFIQASTYNSAIKKYFSVKEKGYDSLMTVSSVHGFLWSQEGPINYDRSEVKWPRTQTLEELFEINSGIFIASREIYKTFSDRIGQNPFLYLTDKITGFDIDWEDDFEIAEAIIKYKKEIA